MSRARKVRRHARTIHDTHGYSVMTATKVQAQLAEAYAVARGFTTRIRPCSNRRGTIGEGYRYVMVARRRRAAEEA